MKGATQMVTSDRHSYPDPKPALEHADRMLRETGPETAGLWPRTAARLIRLAPERAADLHWSRTRPAMTDCPATMRTLIPEGVPGRARARRAFLAWSRLSDATHPHPYELAPAAGLSRVVVWRGAHSVTIARRTLSLAARLAGRMAVTTPPIAA